MLKAQRLTLLPHNLDNDIHMLSINHNHNLITHMYTFLTYSVQHHTPMNRVNNKIQLQLSKQTAGTNRHDDVELNTA